MIGVQTSWHLRQRAKCPADVAASAPQILYCFDPTVPAPSQFFCRSFSLFSFQSRVWKENEASRQTEQKIWATATVPKAPVSPGLMDGPPPGWWFSEIGHFPRWHCSPRTLLLRCCAPATHSFSFKPVGRSPT